MANKLIESKGGQPARMEPDSRTKIGQDVKDAFHQAFLALQRSKKFDLIAWAKKHPTEFYKLCQRFVPADLHVSGTVALQVVTGVPDFIEGEIVESEVGDAHESRPAGDIKPIIEIDDGSDLV